MVKAKKKVSRSLQQPTGRQNNLFQSSKAGDSIFHLGSMLSGGMELGESMNELSVYSGNRRIKTAAALAARRLISGNSPQDVFSGPEMRAFPALARYVLASPLSSRTKGIILSEWKQRPKGLFEIAKGLFAVSISIMSGSMMCLSLLVFVFPQFREIFSSLRMNMQNSDNIGIMFLYFIIRLDYLGTFLISTGLFVTVIAAAILWHRVFNLPGTLDEVNLLRLIKVVPIEERLMVVNVMAVSQAFPSIHSKLRRFTDGCAKGLSLPEAARTAEMGPFMSWMLQLSLKDRADDELIQQGTVLCEARFEGNLERAVRLAEIFSVALQGIFFGMFAYALFSAMNMIMLSNIS